MESVCIPERLNRWFFDTINRPPDRPFVEAGAFDRAFHLAHDANVTVLVLVLRESQNMAVGAASRSRQSMASRQLEWLKTIVATGKPGVLG